MEADASLMPACSLVWADCCKEKLEHQEGRSMTLGLCYCNCSDKSKKYIGAPYSNIFRKKLYFYIS